MHVSGGSVGICGSGALRVGMRLAVPRIRCGLLVIAGLGACGGGPAGEDARAGDDALVDSAGGQDAAGCEPAAAPAEALRPQAGELFYAQLGLGGVSLGEAALLVGPDGTRVLIDVANDSHDDDIEQALQELLGEAVVDHIVITHFHGDHGDGIANLLGRISLRGRIIHRGFTDLTPAANDATIEELCLATVAAGTGTPLCRSAQQPACDPATWSGTYPAVDCDGLDTADLALGAAELDFVAANGFIGTERYDQVVGPLLADDSNGENARSLLATIEHGAFRMLIAGDLTGGGSATDDVESFYAARLAAVPSRGVDVLHAGHHGRNTSTNAAWVTRLLPDDARSRNAVMGISTAHVNSPHVEVLDALLGGDRLRDGRVWTTTVAPGGATAAGLVDAGGGRILLSTVDGGAGYAIQAVASDGAVLDSRGYASVSACP